MKNRREAEIDWNAVSGAIYRSCYGRTIPGDQQLFEQAFKTDEQRYKKVHQEVKDKVFKEMQMGGM